MPENDKSTIQSLRPLHDLVRKLQYLIYAAVAISVAVTIVYVINFHGSFSDDHGRWGQFGDYMGGILNPALSFLALIGVLLTSALQSRALQAELDHAAEAGEAQSKSSRIQNFESSFFQLLSLHNEIVNAMELFPAGNAVRGRACFAVLLSVFLGELPGHPPTADQWIATYTEFSTRNQHALGHYFRMLYNIIKFIDHAEGIEDKKFYSNLVRAQLSSAELTLLFLNCHSKWADKKFKPLVKKFALLKTIEPTNVEPLKLPPILFYDYTKDAFGGEWPVGIPEAT